MRHAGARPREDPDARSAGHPDADRAQPAARSTRVTGVPVDAGRLGPAGSSAAPGDRTAFVDSDVPLTFTELGARAHAVADWLADSGIGRGDVVAVHVPNCRQYPALHHGLLLAGATPSPTSPRPVPVRSVSSGAAPLPVPLIRRLQALLPDAVIGEGYGLTEVTMQATGDPVHRSGTRKAGTVGVPEATAEAIDGHGWFHTGDVGVLDEEGHLAVVDRTEDMLLHKGYNVFPCEPEEVLFGVPWLAGAAVVGRPDEEAGELPVAHVVRRADDAGAALTPASVMAAVNERVTPYERLRDVVSIDAIPVSAAGKVLERELAAREREAVAAD